MLVFVYVYTVYSELVASRGKDETAVCDYCLSLLEALELRWGPTHTGLLT